MREKRLSKILTTVVLVLSSAAIFACSARNDKKCCGQKRLKTPEQRVEKMAKHLDLNETQKQSIQTLLIAQKEAFENGLKSILNEVQMQKFEAARAKREGSSNSENVKSCGSDSKRSSCSKK